MRRPMLGDPYHSITAALSARDLRDTVCRAIATMGIAVGAFHIALLLFSDRHVDLSAPLTAGVLFVVGAGLSAFWLSRHRWPTCSGSYAAVIGGAGLTTIACLSFGDPLYGLLGAAPFVMLTGYVGMFHHDLLQVVPVSAGVLTVATLCGRLVDDGESSRAVTGAIMLLLVGVGTFVVARMVRGICSASCRSEEVEPLTGLLNDDAFHTRALTVLGSRDRRADRFVVLVLVKIDGWSAIRDVAGRRTADRARLGTARALAETVRRDAVLAHPRNDEFVVLDVFENEDATPLVERIRSAMCTVRPRTTVSIGMVSRPFAVMAAHDSLDALDALITLSREAAHRAQRAGGNADHCDIGYLLDVDRDGRHDDGPPFAAETV